MVEAIAANRSPRASVDLGRHVLEVARTILVAASERRVLEVATSVEPPAPMPVEK